MPSRNFEQFAGMSALFTGAAGLLYAVSFIIAQSPFYSALCLTAFGLLAVAPWLAMYLRVKSIDLGFASLGLTLGLAGVIGATLHGGYDLAISVNPQVVAGQPAADLPNQIDPRGLATFGFSGFGLAVLARLITASDRLPKTLGYLGYVSAMLLVLLYLGRLIIVQPSHPLILIPALLNGFIIGPLFYFMLGYGLLRANPDASPLGTEPAQRAM